MTTSSDHTARIWNTVTGECEAVLKGHSNWVNSAVFSSDGAHIVSVSSDHTARIWDRATGECEAVLTGYSNWVKSAVVSASDDHTATIWNTARGECEAELQKHTSVLRTLNCLLHHFLLVFFLLMLHMESFMFHHVHLSLTHMMILYFTPQTFKKSAFHLLTVI